MLAAKLMLEQGIHVEGLNFYTGFCHSGHTSGIRANKQKRPQRNDALWVAEQLGIKLHIIDAVQEYQDVLLNPKYGYGKNLNPCLDCKVFMVRRAMAWIEKHEFDFVVTGEVVGQRPKSQRRDTMHIVARDSGSNERLLRPLCAHSFPETLPEREGWVDREKLLRFNGRNRTPQIELAKQYGWDDFSQPAGGCCVLTDESYSKKLQDFWQHRPQRDYSLDDIILLKVGRHLRPNSRFKLVIGREEGENKFLEGYRKLFIHIRHAEHIGPLVLLDGEPNADDVMLATRIAARFGQARQLEQVPMTIYYPDERTESCSISPFAAADIPQAWYV